MLRTFAISTICTLFTITTYANMHIAPLELNLSQKKRTDFLRLTNNSSSDRVYQPIIVKKNYEKEGAPYEPSRNLMAVPLEFEIFPKETQLIRVIARMDVKKDIVDQNSAKAAISASMPMVTRELQQKAAEPEYRILIKELPKKGVTTSGVGFLTTFSVPIRIKDITSDLKQKQEYNSLSSGAQSDNLSGVVPSSNLKQKEQYNSSSSSAQSDNLSGVVPSSNLKQKEQYNSSSSGAQSDNLSGK